MPQLHVFFLGLPGAILIGFTILLTLVGVLMGVFLDYLGSVLGQLAPGQ
jgi:flagellar biosynthetic protein FliR